MTTVSGVRGSRILSVFLLLFLAAAPLIAHASPRGDEPFADPLSGQGNGSAKSTPAVPHEYDLAQNFPNPFNPSTVIEFALPKDAHVRLEVYNIIGQKVMTLVDEVRPAGYHSVKLDGTNLASGMYLYRLTTGQQTFMKKLLLMK